MRTGLSWGTFMSAAASGEGGEGGGGEGEPSGSAASSLGTGAGDPSPDGGEPAVTPTPGEPVPGGTVPEWAENYSDVDNRNFLAKRGERWSGPEDVLRSYRDLESLRGVPETQLLKLVDTEDKEAWHGPGGIYSRLGRPDNADQYNLPKIEETGEVFDITKPFRDAAFEQGLSGTQVETIGAAVFGKMFEFQEAYNTTLKQNMEAGIETLKREWGTEYDSNHAIASKGAEALGFDVSSEEGLNTLLVLEKEIGTRNFLHHMLQIGQRLGEHQAGEHGDGQGQSGYMTADQARAEIDRLNNDPEFLEKYLKGAKEYPDENARMSQLFKFANPPR